MYVYRYFVAHNFLCEFPFITLGVLFLKRFSVHNFYHYVDECMYATEHIFLYFFPRFGAKLPQCYFSMSVPTISSSLSLFYFSFGAFFTRLLVFYDFTTVCSIFFISTLIINIQWVWNVGILWRRSLLCFLAFKGRQLFIDIVCISIKMWYV